MPPSLNLRLALRLAAQGDVLKKFIMTRDVTVNESIWSRVFVLLAIAVHYPSPLAPMWHRTQISQAEDQGSGFKLKSS